MQQPDFEPTARAGTPPTSGTQPGRAGVVEPSLPQEDLTRDRLLGTLQRDDRNRPLLGRIPLVCRLGKGGMGTVYYGLHPRLRLEVAVKVLPFHLVEEDPRLVDRFASEARMAATLSSEHVVRVLDVDQDSDTHFLVMEYVPGESAGALLKKRGALPEAEALRIVTAATRGLAAAHAQGIIHRDVKPDNILIPRGDLAKAKLADLGLAKPEGDPHTLGTQSRIAMGTPGFMAPEQIENARAAGPAADVFSMGATLYALLSGRGPFAGTSVAVILQETAKASPPPLPETVSPGLRAVVHRCLAKRPEDRFANGGELLRALEGLAVGVTPLPGPTQISLPTPTRRGPALRLALFAAVVLAAVVAAAFWRPGSGPRPAPSPAPSPFAAAELDAAIARWKHEEVFTRWEGTWAGSSGFVFDYVMELTFYQDLVESFITWTLRHAPQDRPELIARLNESATEFVEGEFVPGTRIVELKGIRVSDDKLLATDEYRLNFPVEGAAFQRITCGNDLTWRNTIRGRLSFPERPRR